MSDRTHLQMTDPGQHRRSSSANTLEVRLLTDDRVRDLTLEVGRGYAWPSQVWDEVRWAEYLDDHTRQHWVAMLAEEVVGLLSLDLTRFPEVEIESFGLLPECIGQGLGGAVLSAFVDLVWSLGATRIWLHTSIDAHPRAVDNYVKRGFSRYHPAPNHPDFFG